MPRPRFGFDAEAHERHHGWRSLVFKLAIGAVTTWVVWRFGGWTGLLVSLMLWARLLADELMAGLLMAWHALRGLAFRPVQGRYYQFKGHRIRVEDDELLRQRWLSVGDLSRALGAPMPLPTLRRRWPDGLREQRDGVYVLDDVAMAWLAEQRDARAARFRQWVERDVWYPVRGRKAGLIEARSPEGAPEQHR